jgi:hypothetical protein
MLSWSKISSQAFLDDFSIQELYALATFEPKPLFSYSDGRIVLRGF